MGTPLHGPRKCVLIREVSFQRLICTQKYTIGTSETVLIREVSLFQRLDLYTKVYYWDLRNCPHERGVLILEVDLYTKAHYVLGLQMIREVSIFHLNVLILMSTHFSIDIIHKP